MLLPPSLHLQMGTTNTSVVVSAVFVEKEMDQKSEAEVEDARKVTAAEGEIDRVTLVHEAEALDIKPAMQAT
jgi:hypothetical protein